MPASEPGGDLDDLRPVPRDPELRVGRPVLDSERRDSLAGDLGRLDRGVGLGRPHVRQGHPEGRRVGGEPVGHRQREEPPPSTENAFTVTSGPSATSSTSAWPFRDSARARVIASLEVGGVLDEAQASLALPVGRLDDARNRQPVLQSGHEVPGRLRHAGRGEPLALPGLGGGEDGGGRRERVRDADPSRRPALRSRRASRFPARRSRPPARPPRAAGSRARPRSR